MIEFYAQGQRLTFYTPVVAADSLNYLTAHVFFSPEWDGYTRWMHFRKGETVYDVELNEADEITADDSLNLTVGEWEIYAHGTMSDSRITTIPVMLTVKESGLIDGPLHVLPQTVAEQLDSKASIALQLSQAVKNAADRGEFNGKDGISGSVVGYFDTLEELEAAITDPVKGEMYAVGYDYPYDIYGYDFVGGTGWRNNGNIQGPPGATGERGVTFTPSVDASGFISWTNDGGLDNPETKNISGPAGARGERGTKGTSAYESAVAGGYTGTERTFNDALSSFPYHNARHLPNGADPISVETGNISNGAVTQAKLASNAVSTIYTATIPATGWDDNSITISVSGLLATDTPIADVDMSEVDAEDVEDVQDAFALVYRMVAGTNALTVYATDVPETAIPIRLLCVRR